MPRIIATSYMKPSRTAVQQALEAIRDCSVVVGVTDTLYGVFADPFRSECIREVYRVKRRGGKPIPLLADSIDTVLEYAYTASDVEGFLEIIWPGPVTVILKLAEPSSVVGEVHLSSGKVGLRVPAAPLPRLIARELGGLVTGTSANISGQPPARVINEALEQLGDNVGLYIDSGPAPLGVGSTVIDLTEGFNVIRVGALDPSVVRSLYELFAGK